MSRALVTVIVPIHLEEPSELEKISLTQTLAVLRRHPITFLAPAKLDTTWYENFCHGKARIEFARFTWQGHREFGELLVSPAFFRAFQAYHYILVCHLDAFVFRDELEQWCHLGYDYLSSVIYNPIWQCLNTPFRNLIGFGLSEYLGNGGFSLKKVDTFYRLASTFRPLIAAFCWVGRKRGQAFLEDLFIARYFPKLSPGFRTPTRAVAQQFGAAYEDDDVVPLPFDGQAINSLPFGMHGWIKYKREYWKPIIRQYGHQL